MSVSVFDLFAKIKLDSSEYDKGLDDAEKRSGDVGSKIGSGLAAAGKAAGVAIGAAATAVAGLTIQAKNAYAEQEQLVGGVETLFGKASKSVIENAKQAFTTAGMSANEYMETVTSFSASLIQSLGGDTKKAAEYADMALVDMSDNANKMGTSMESIQNAYQGFAKQNYNMLDNLKLGYGGTQKEMFRLMQDAAKLDKKFAETAQFSLDEKGHLEAGYADIVQAIHIVQDQMGISGTTIAEAGETISGSAGQVKAAWENLVAGFASPDADLGALINNVVVSAETAFKNMMPAIEQALSGIGSFIEQMVPIISEKLPEAVGQILPSLLKAATSLVQGVVTALPELITVLVEQVPTVLQQLATAVIETAPTLIESVHELFDMVVEGINEAIPILLEKAPQIISDLINGINTALPLVVEAATSIISTLAEGIAQNLPTMIQEGLNALVEFSGTIKNGAGELISAGIDLITALADGIMDSLPSITSAAMDILNGALDTLTSNMPSFLDQGVEMITNLANGLLNALPQVLDGIGQIISKLLDFVIANFPTIMQNGMKLIINLAQGLIKALPNVIQSVVKIITGLVNQLIAAIPTIIQTGFKLIAQLALGLLKALPDIVKAALALAKGVIDTFTQTDWLSIGVNIIKGIISGIGSMAKMFLDAIVNLAKSAFDGIKNFFGIHSPSKKMRDEIGKNIVKGLIEGVDSEKKNAKKSAEELGALYVSAAKKKVDTLKANNKLSLQEEWAYWEEVREHTKKGTQAYDEATKMIGKAKANISKGMAEAEKSYIDGVAKITENLDKEVQKLEETYQQAVNKRRDDILGQMGLFKEFKPEEAIDNTNLLTNLQSQVDALNTWNETLTQLEEKIGGTELYEELEGMGVSSLSTLQNLNAMSAEELEKYKQLYDEKVRLATARAETEHEDLKAQTEEQITNLKETATKQIGELEKQYKKDIKQLGLDSNKAFNKAGKYSVKGMQQGMNEQMDILEVNMMARARQLAEAVRKALEINSPSRVFANEVGKWIPLGIEKGFTDAMPEAEKGMLASIEDMKANMAGAVDMSTTLGMGDVESPDSPIANILYGIYDLLSGMPDDMKAAMDNTAISINNREFARLVKAV